MSEKKQPGGLFFRSDTPRIGRNEASAVPSAHFDHIRGEGTRLATTTVWLRLRFLIAYAGLSKWSQRGGLEKLSFSSLKNRENP